MPQPSPDVRTELDEAPLRPFHWLVVCLVTLATMLDGYDTFIPSYQAARLLARIRPDRAELYRSAGLTITAPPPTRDLRLVLGPGYRRRTLVLWASSFLLLFDGYGLSAWTPRLMIQRGHGFVIRYSFGAVLRGMSIVGAIVGGVIADRYLGARRGLMVWCGLGAASALLMAFTGSLAGSVVAIAAAGLFILGGQFLLNNACAVSYPVQARGTGEGLMLGVGWAGGILGPYLGGGLLGAFGGTSVLFVAVAVAAALAVVSVSFVTAHAPRVRPAQGVTA